MGCCCHASVPRKQKLLKYEWYIQIHIYYYSPITDMDDMALLYNAL